MHIPDDDTPNYPFCRLLKRLNTQLNEPTNQNSIKVPKDFLPTYKKSLLINFGD